MLFSRNRLNHRERGINLKRIPRQTAGRITIRVTTMLARKRGVRDRIRTCVSFMNIVKKIAARRFAERHRRSTERKRGRA